MNSFGENLLRENLYKDFYKDLQQPGNREKIPKLSNLEAFQGLKILDKMKDSDGVGEKVAKTLIKQSTFPPWATWGKEPEMEVLKIFLMNVHIKVFSSRATESEAKGFLNNSRALPGGW